MKAAISEQMRKIDREAMDIYGIPGVVLMENAGLRVYSHVMDKSGSSGGPICIICGSGNNGGDGFTAARHLYLKNMDITVFIIGDGKGIRGDALVNYNIIKKMGLDIRYVTEEGCLHELVSEIEKSCIVVDALLGTGVKGEVRGIYGDVINIINQYSRYVISVDIPSGVDADTGKVLGTGVHADETVTFALPKIGLFSYPGAVYAGRIAIEDISIPKGLIECQKINTNLIMAEDIAPLFPPRDKDSHKGTYGKAYILGGSSGMMGAAAMCILSSLRCGSGLVEAGVPLSIQNQVAPIVMEAMVKGLEDEEGKISYNAKSQVMKSLESSDAFAIGPGLSKSQGLFSLISDIIEESEIPGVIDADGLNLLSQNPGLLLKAKKTLIITPHPGEMARLIKKDVKYVQDNRIDCAREFSYEHKVVTVLKGPGTVVASPDGEVFINTTGNPGMARGGSGDVLTGMIVSFIARGINPTMAAAAGVYIHGLSGDMASQSKGEYGMKAGDIIECIPGAINYLSGL